ncbi:methyltransferase family protein [Psychroserpens sp. BH13MA-6]
MTLQKKDYGFVALQMILFVLYLWDFNLFEFELSFYQRASALSIAFIGMIIVAIAIIQLNTKISPFPTPRSNSELIVYGLYRYSRHPIYTGILLTCAGYAFYSNSIYKLIITTLLYVLFFFKSNYEEQQLMQKFPSYRSYKNRTGRFFPKRL